MDGQWSDGRWSVVGQGRNARPPFFHCLNFSGASLFQFFGKVANFQKINFPFFHFFDFSEIWHFFSIFCKMALALEDGQLNFRDWAHYGPGHFLFGSVGRPIGRSVGSAGDAKKVFLKNRFFEKFSISVFFDFLAIFRLILTVPCDARWKNTQTVLFS